MINQGLFFRMGGWQHLAHGDYLHQQPHVRPDDKGLKDNVHGPACCHRGHSWPFCWLLHYKRDWGWRTLTLVIYANLTPQQVIYFMVKAVFGILRCQRKARKHQKLNNRQENSLEIEMLHSSKCMYIQLCTAQCTNMNKGCISGTTILQNVCIKKFVVIRCTAHHV